jgi:uncharacterized membrane protein
MDFLLNLRNALIAGLVLAGLLLAFMIYQDGLPTTLPPVLARLLHVGFGAVWLGLIWYFNVVAGNAPRSFDEAQAARSAVLVALLGRLLVSSAVATVALGFVLALFDNYTLRMLSLDAVDGFVNPIMTEIGVGAWIGLLMFANVWFVIWPSLQRAYNVGGRFKKLTPERRAAAARRALLYSRINLMLSIPVLLAMVGFAHLY